MSAAKDASDPLDAIERALVALRRSMSKRELGQRLVEEMSESDAAVAGQPIDLGVLEVLDAIETGPAADGEVSVGDVAERLAIDPSRASRRVAQVVALGLVRRVPSQRDGRRAQLELTEDGQALERGMSRLRGRYIAERTADWSDADLRRFARLFGRFTAP